METTSFRSPFEKVYRRTKSTLLRRGFDISEDENNPGILMASKKPTLMKAAQKLKVIITKIDNTSTTLTIYSDAGRHWIDKANSKNRLIEGRFIAMITSRM